MKTSTWFLFLVILVTAETTDSRKSFSHKIIYTDTPDIGRKWHGGIRMTDILVLDINLNMADWVLVDFLRMGLKDLHTEEGGKLTDYFNLVTLKSPPLARKTKMGLYQIAGGIKFYEAGFTVSDSTTNAGQELTSNDESAMLFVSQGVSHHRHYANLFTSLSFREKKFSDGDKTVTTYYVVPGYRFKLSRNWFINCEYYLTNTEKLPIKILQFLLDAEKWEFHNPNRDLYSFMFYGFQYAGKHLRVDLSLGNHISFEGPVFPVFGLGWTF